MRLQKIHNSLKFNSCFDQKEAISFSQMSAENIEELKTKTKSNILYKGVVPYYCVFGLIALAGSLWSCQREPSFPNAFYSTIFWVVICAWLGVVLERAVTLVFFDPKELLKYLVPLSESPELCAVALQHCETAQGRIYRENVLKAAREFLLADFMNLERLALLERQGKTDMQMMEACKRLHGIQP